MAKSELPVPPTARELADSIEHALIKLHGNVSKERTHPVESHLRLCIRKAGFKVRETAAAPATLQELAGQTAQAIGYLNDETPQEDYDYIHQHLSTTLSNLNAEVAGTSGPALRDLPELK